jgi:hypothetical protein
MNVRSWRIVGGLAVVALSAGTVLAIPAHAEQLPTMAAAAGNLAVDRPAASEQRPCTATETPAKAVDGSVTGYSSKWCSADGPTKTMQVDLGSNRAIGGFVVRHAGAGGEATAANTKNFTIAVSTGGGVWTNAVTVTGNTASVTEHPVSRTARWIRISTTDAIARIYELEAYAAGGPAAGVRVLYVDATAAQGIAAAIDEGMAGWNTSVPTIRLTRAPAGQAADIRIEAGPGWAWAVRHELGSGDVNIGADALADGHYPARLVAHELGHILGLPDSTTGSCQEIMAGPPQTCRNTVPNAAEAATVRTSFEVAAAGATTGAGASGSSLLSDRDVIR